MKRLFFFIKLFTVQIIIINKGIKHIIDFGNGERTWIQDNIFKKVAGN